MSNDRYGGMKPDFRVSYRFFSPTEGGRKSPPFQGYRCDFCYAGEDPKDGIYMIWPEFLDQKGQIVSDLSTPVEQIGEANMRIVMPTMRRTVHLGKLAVGTKGFFMEGPRKVGEVRVVELLALSENAETIEG